MFYLTLVLYTLTNDSYNINNIKNFNADIIMLKINCLKTFFFLSFCEELFLETNITFFEKNYAIQ